MAQNYEKIKKKYNEIINDIESSVNELFSLCCQYQEIYFGVEEFISNFKKYENDINNVLEKEKGFFDEISFSALKKDSSEIKFDGQFFKIEDFKKIKKPAQLEQRESTPNR